MRISGLVYATAVVACFSSSTSHAEGAGQHSAAAATTEEQIEPYHKHHDTRHGHDHFYPDRGAIVRDLPQGTIGTSYAGVSYRYHDGIWLEPRGPAYMVIAPPIGLVAPTLPLYSTVVTHGTETFLYVNDTYYRPRPDLGGYEVVNDPTEEAAPAAAPDALVGGQLPAAPVTTTPTANAAVLAAAPAAGASVAAAPTSAPLPQNGIPTQAASFSPPAAAPVVAASAASVPVALSAGAVTAGTPKGPKVFLYPKNGQAADQQAHDRYDCYRFAVAQSGFDPMRGAASAAGSEQQSDYERAQSACFEGRGYSNR